MPKYVFCPNCGTRNPATAQFCFKCGSKLLKNKSSVEKSKPNPTNDTKPSGKGKKCPNCHKLNPANVRICKYCGYDFVTHKSKDYYQNKDKNIKRTIKPKKNNGSNSNKGCVWIIIAVIIVAIVLGIKGCSSFNNGGYSMPSNPQTNQGKAEVDRTLIVKNMKKNDPSVQIKSATTNRAGTVNIKTNLQTPSVSKLHHIWDNAYINSDSQGYAVPKIHLENSSGQILANPDPLSSLLNPNDDIYNGDD